MALGKLSSLGIGSGVLNSDVIDKLKKADEHMMIAPIDRKIKTNIEKQKSLIEIKELVSALHGDTKTLSDYSTYIARKADVSGDSITASVRPGVPTQDVRVHVNAMAKNDVNEVGTRFYNRDDAFTHKDVTISFYHHNKTYSIDVRGEESVGSVAQKITDATDGAVVGVMMKTGGAKPYQLLINSRDSGEENRIYFGNTVRSVAFNDGGEKDVDGNFTLALLDGKDAKKTLNINVDFNNNQDTSAHAKALTVKAAIIKAIEASPDLKDLLNKDITVALGSDGKSVLINDRRGYDISFGGALSSTMKFDNVDPYVKNLITTKKPIAAGKLHGKISFGSVPINLADISNKKNTSEQNAKNLAEAINNIAGMFAKTDGKGKLFINSETGEMNIEGGTDKASKEFVQSIGLKTGIVENYAKVQNSVLKLKNLQRGQDASIEYNGVRIDRPKNSIDDIISGLTINLQKVTPKGETDIIHIVSDKESVIKALQGFVKNYNKLVPRLTEATRYDPDSKVAGLFNGVSFIRNIRPELNSIVSYTMNNNEDNGMGGRPNISSLMEYGISLNRESKMTLDMSTLNEALSKDPEKVQDFFYGKMQKGLYGKEVHVKGVFEKFNDAINSLVRGSKGSLNLYTDELDKDARNLQKDKKRSMKLLNDRYSTMASRFMAYDDQIAKANAGFSSVQMMIDQSTKSKK